MADLTARSAEANVKLRHLRELLRARDAQALVLTRSANFAWLSGGGRAFIAAAAETGAAWIIVTPDGVRVVSSNIEAMRLRAEELYGLDWELTATPWWESGGVTAAVERLLPAAGRLADAPLQGTTDVGAELVALRTRLEPEEQIRAASLGQALAVSLENCCQAIRPGETEDAIAGRLAEGCLARGIEPVVHLIAADERALTRRHPLPTGRVVRHLALVAACGMRDGLVLSASRLVHFGQPAAGLVRRWTAAAEVSAEMIAATVPGATAGDVMAAAQTAYARLGFADEWRNHHQGGLAGYASRESRVVPGSNAPISVAQLYAWNPSLPGAKSEDTVLTTAAGEPTNLTQTGNWPLRAVRTSGGTVVRRPEVLLL